MILVSDALKYTNTLNTVILYWAPWCYPTRWQQIWLINVWNKHASMHLNLDCNEFGVKKRGILRTLIFLVWYRYCFHLFCEKTTLVSWVKHLVSGHISSSSHMSRALIHTFWFLQSVAHHIATTRKRRPDAYQLNQFVSDQLSLVAGEICWGWLGPLIISLSKIMHIVRTGSMSRVMEGCV